MAHRNDDLLSSMYWILAVLRVVSLDSTLRYKSIVTKAQQ